MSDFVEGIQQVVCETFPHLTAFGPSCMFVCHSSQTGLRQAAGSETLDRASSADPVYPAYDSGVSENDGVGNKIGLEKVGCLLIFVSQNFQCRNLCIPKKFSDALE